MHRDELAARLASLSDEPLAAQAAALEEVQRALQAEFEELSAAGDDEAPAGLATD